MFPAAAKQGVDGGQYCQTLQPASLQQASVQAAALTMPPMEARFWHQAPVSFIGNELASQALLEELATFQAVLVGFAMSEPLWIRMFAVYVGMMSGSDMRNSPPSRSIVQPPASRMLTGKRPFVTLLALMQVCSAFCSASVESRRPVGSPPNCFGDTRSDGEAGGALDRPPSNFLRLENRFRNAAGAFDNIICSASNFTAGEASATVASVAAKQSLASIGFGLQGHCDQWAI
jgi:hypothetical protein